MLFNRPLSSFCLESRKDQKRSERALLWVAPGSTYAHCVGASLDYPVVGLFDTSNIRTFLEQVSNPIHVSIGLVPGSLAIDTFYFVRRSVRIHNVLRSKLAHPTLSAFMTLPWCCASPSSSLIPLGKLSELAGFL